jgi:hypothetical protein
MIEQDVGAGVRGENHRTGKLYHLRLRVECTLFCYLQSRARTHAVLVIGLYEFLVRPVLIVIFLNMARCTRYYVFSINLLMTCWSVVFSW